MATKQKACPACGNTEINSKMSKCPNCGAKLSKPIYKKWWFWVIIALGIILIANAGSSSDEGPSSSNNPSQEASSNAAENNTSKYTKVDLQQMLDELEENALKAEKTYNNTYVEITGKIANFDSDGTYISIEPVNASEWNFDTVMCYIKNDDQLDFLLEKSKGDTVTIKGKIFSVGEFLGYSLNIDSIK